MFVIPYKSGVFEGVPGVVNKLFKTGVGGFGWVFFRRKKCESRGWGRGNFI